MSFRRGTLNDIFKDYIVFRELRPIKEGLSSFEELGNKSHKGFPRKKDKEYAAILCQIFRSAMSFSKIVYIGDTFLSDLAVIENIKELGYDVFGVITDETGKNSESKYPYIVFNNSWDQLSNYVVDKINNETVLVVDIDKTAIGARGRNDSSVDKARTDAILDLAKRVFKNPEKDEFMRLYHYIHAKDFLNFTQDNQDIVSILSLIIYSNAISFDDFSSFAKTRKFEEFIQDVKVQGELVPLVDEVRTNIREDNATLFPTFRRIELEKTLNRMDFLPDDTPIEKLLEEEILITGEVYRIGIRANEKGALVFGVSDKPEKASFNDSKALFRKTAKIYP
ncbi:MAG: hypothetical protein ACP5SB_01385 [Caldisericaceae bacterium]